MLFILFGIYLLSHDILNELLKELLKFKDDRLEVLIFLATSIKSIEKFKVFL